MRVIRKVVFWCLALLLAATCYALQRGLDTIKAKASKNLVWDVPEARTIRIMTFGFEPIVADFYWAKSLIYIAGQFDREHKDYTPLWKVCDVITDLDRRFTIVYHYGSLFISGLAKEPEKAIELLKKGLDRNEKDWRFRWLLNYDVGTTYSFRLGDREAARPYLDAAARDPNCPPGITGLVAKVLSAQSAERYKVAFEIWKERRDKARGPIMRQIAEEEMRRAQSNIYLEELRDAAAKFEEHYGKKPGSVAELMEAGMISAVPEDPLGGRFDINDDGDVVRLSAR